MPQTAQAILARHGIQGQLLHMYANRWEYRGTKGKQGVAVEFDGEPDEADQRFAAAKIIEAFSGH